MGITVDKLSFTFRSPSAKTLWATVSIYLPYVIRGIQLGRGGLLGVGRLSSPAIGIAGYQAIPQRIALFGPDAISLWCVRLAAGMVRELSGCRYGVVTDMESPQPPRYHRSDILVCESQARLIKLHGKLD